MIYELSNSLDVKADFDESSIMNLSMVHSTPEIAIDFLDELMNTYRERDYISKLSSIKRSLIFLRDQIKQTQSRLHDRELIAQKFFISTKWTISY